MALDLSSIFYVTKNLSISLLYRNVNGAKLWENGERLPQVFVFAASWRVYSRVELLSEIYKDTAYPFVTKFGTRIKIIPHIYGMVGVKFSPDRYSYGLCCFWKALEISAAYQSHFDLPHTIYFGCKISIK